MALKDQFSPTSILSSIGAFTNPYGLPAEPYWALNNASFTPFDGPFAGEKIEFYVADNKEDDPSALSGLENIDDQGGRRIVPYEYPYLDGQKVDDLGRRGEKWTFSITFFGKNYKKRYDAFYRGVINISATGSLVHPVKGNLPARLSEYQFVHSHDHFNAVRMRVVFIEDNSREIDQAGNVAFSSGVINSVLQTALGTLVKAQAFIGEKIFEVSSLLLLPAATKAGMQLRVDSITGALSRLLGQMASTFGTDQRLLDLGSSTGGFLQATGGTLISGSGVPPVFQVGLTTEEQTAVNSSSADFVNSNQTTAQQLVFLTNQTRTAIAEAIAYTESNTGSSGSEIVQTYRDLAVAFQKAAEACLGKSAQTVLYTVPYDMTLREAAFLNGLNVDRQNDIELLNPSLESINFVPRGTILSVPAA